MGFQSSGPLASGDMSIYLTPLSYFNEPYFINRVGQAIKQSRTRTAAEKEESSTGKSTKAWQRLNKALWTSMVGKKDISADNGSILY